MIQALRSGSDVIIDDTNLHPKHEDRIREVVEAQAQIDNRKYTVAVKVFDASPEECVKRNKRREHRVDAAVIWGMWRDFIYKPEPVVQDETLPQAAIFDLDGTLALMGDRNPYDASECEYDKLNEPVNTALRKYQADGYKIIISSGRSDKYIEETKRWLDKNGIKPDMLLMRKEQEAVDRIQDSIIKRKMLEEHIIPKYFVEVVYDDRDRVVQMWRDAGLTCFQVANGNF